MQLFHIRHVGSAPLQSVQNAADSKGGGFRKERRSFNSLGIHLF